MELLQSTSKTAFDKDAHIEFFDRGMPEEMNSDEDASDSEHNEQDVERFTERPEANEDVLFAFFVLDLVLTEFWWRLGRFVDVSGSGEIGLTDIAKFANLFVLMHHNCLVLALGIICELDGAKVKIGVKDLDY